MELQLIEGDFLAADALDLVTKMIQIKIKYHEDKINNDHSEEDVKTREAKIKKLQDQLADFRKTIQESTSNTLSLYSKIVVI